jgi:hypothetical protein
VGAGALVILGVAVGMLLVSSRRRPHLEPQTYFELRTIDLGLLQDRSATHTLELQNDGSTVWTVQSAQAECSCLTLAPRSRTTAPGETLFVDMRLVPGARVGPMSVRFWIKFDGDPGLALGNLRADVWLGPYLDPNTIELTLAPNQSEFRSESNLWTLAEDNVRPIALGNDARVKATFGAPIPDGRRMKWPITITGSTPDQRGDRSFLQQISADNGPDALPLTIVVRRPSELRASPSAAILAAGRSGTLILVDVWESQERDTDLASVELRAEPSLEESLRATWRNGTLELASDVPIAPGHGVVRLTTLDGNDLELPVHVLDASVME